MTRPGREFLGTQERWPWLLGFNGFTALLQLATLPFLPESPKFLVLNRGDRQACEKGGRRHAWLPGVLCIKTILSKVCFITTCLCSQALTRLWGPKDHSAAVEEMLEEKAVLQSTHNHSLIELLQNRALRWQLLTIVVTFSALQLCGINAVSSSEMHRAVLRLAKC